MHRLPFIVFISLVALLLAAMIFNTSHTPRHGTSLNQFPIASLEALTKLSGDGAPTTRYVLVNIFASWCIPCQAEHPVISEIARRADVSVLGLAWKDSQTKVEAWLDKHGNPYHSVWIDTSGQLGVELGIRGVPETYLVEWASRKILYHLPGPLDEETFVQQILPLMK